MIKHNSVPHGDLFDMVHPSEWKSPFRELASSEPLWQIGYRDDCSRRYLTDPAMYSVHRATYSGSNAVVTNCFEVIYAYELQ